jgi:hypothetical protein
MSNDKEENIFEPKLVEEVSDYVSTDTIIDLKTGIYNLFISLLNHLTVTHGPVKAVEISTQFLDDISNKFKETLQ